jgi:hypothetical protein
MFEELVADIYICMTPKRGRVRAMDRHAVWGKGSELRRLDERREPCMQSAVGYAVKAMGKGI